jgi:tetratricopeptide (TPR) repeat protein
MFKQSEECYHKYMELLENNLGGECATLSNGYFTLGNYYFRRGKIKKAGMCFDHSSEIRSNLDNKCEDAVSHCKVNKALCLFELNQVEESLALLKEVEREIKQYKGKENALIAKVYQIMCYCS